MEPKSQNEQETGRDNEAWQAHLRKELESDDAYQRRVWGGTDEVLRARYTAGMCTDEEKARVEQAMRDYPAVRESIEVVREVNAQQEANAGEKPGGESPRSGFRDHPAKDSGPSR